MTIQLSVHPKQQSFLFLTQATTSIFRLSQQLRKVHSYSVQILIQLAVITFLMIKQPPMCVFFQVSIHSKQTFGLQETQHSFSAGGTTKMIKNYHCDKNQKNTESSVNLRYKCFLCEGQCKTLNNNVNIFWKTCFPFLTMLERANSKQFLCF